MWRTLSRLCYCFSLYILIAIAQNSQANSLISLEQTINQHQGKVIYLDFWASWCAPCRQSFPWLNQMQKKYQTQGFIIVSINLDYNKKLADNFLKDQPANFTIIYDPQGATSKKFKLTAMPTSFLINRQGKIIASHAGFNNEKKHKIEQQIQLALKK